MDKTEGTMRGSQPPQDGDSKKWLDIANAIHDLDQKILALEIELGLSARTDAQKMQCKEPGQKTDI